MDYYRVLPKMEALLKLTAFTLCMLAGSYLAGSVPLAFTFAEVSALVNVLILHYLWRGEGTTVVMQRASDTQTLFHLLRTNSD